MKAQEDKLVEVPLETSEEGRVDWLESEEFLFPELKNAFKQKEKEDEKYRQTLAKIDEKIADLKEKEQAVFNRLLTAQGEELREAVVHAIKYLDWNNVIDVNDYWKHVIRAKEEDLWLLDDNVMSIEEKIREGFVVLVSIRDGTGETPDEDSIVLQKYKGRRMQEFNNTKMKSLLIGNYFCKENAVLRKNPYSARQVDDAEKDGNGLLTTYELFKAVKAEKEGKISKEEIRAQLKQKSGFISINY